MPGSAKIKMKNGNWRRKTWRRKLEEETQYDGNRRWCNSMVGEMGGDGLLLLWLGLSSL